MTYDPYIDGDDLAEAPDYAPCLVRIDPALGFVKGNVAIVSVKAARWLEGKSIEDRRLAVTRGFR
jgi:hypothetical protein